MKVEHQVDGKGRIRLNKFVEDSIGSEGKKKIIFFEDHITILREEDYEDYIKPYVEAAKNPRLAKIAIANETIDYSLDNQGRFLIPKEYRKQNMIGNQLLFFEVDYDGINSIEIYEKSTYESLMSEYYSPEKKGLKNLTKGNERV